MAFENSFVLNIGLIVGIVGVITLVIWATTSKRKKDKRKMLSWIWVIGLGAFLVGGFANVPFLTDQIDLGDTFSAAPSGVNQGGLPEGTVCAVEDTTVTLSSIDAYTAAATGGTHRYKVNGAPALTVSNAGTFTASPGDKLSILWLNGSESTANYFSEVSEYVIPCAGTKTFSSELYQNGSFNIRIFNEEGNLLDSSGENETLGTGDVVNLDMDLQGQYQRAYHHGLIVVAEYDKNNYTDVQVQLGGMEVDVPNVFASTNTSWTAKAYTIPPLIGNDRVSGTLYIEVDSSANPTAIADILLTFYPQDYFVNDDTGGSFDGPAPEDEDDTATRSGTETFTVAID